MPLPFVREFKLAESRGDGRHPYVNSDGAFIGRGVPLLQRDALGQWKPRDESVIERLLGRGYGGPFKLNWRYQQLGYVAKALNEGNLALASISLLRMQLAPLLSEKHALAMARVDGVLAKENPEWENEPRVPAGNIGGGEWTSNGGDAADASIQPAAAQGDDTQARKKRFVDAHLADAQKLADQLGVPVENILGASAIESGWGQHPFAAQGNNYFGIHYPAPFATGYMLASSGVRVATFDSYADSLRSFAAITGSFVQGVADPADFAAALQNRGRFGIDPQTGQKKPRYVPDLAATIRGLRAIVARRRV
jgi:hypothetical protein